MATLLHTLNHPANKNKYKLETITEWKQFWETFLRSDNITTVNKTKLKHYKLNTKSMDPNPTLSLLTFPYTKPTNGNFEFEIENKKMHTH